MKEHSGETVSVWMATQALPDFQPLTRDLSGDVCIVGAGIAGLTTAYLLQREGREVVVLDDGPIVSGETERTTAHLASEQDDGFSEIEKVHGEDGARIAYESHSAAIDKIEEIVTRENSACDFERLDGYLFLGVEDDAAVLERELHAARRAGFVDARMIERLPILDFNSGPALQFPRQGQFHPTRYLAALAKAIVRDGGHIFTHTHATEMEGGRDTYVKVATGQTVRTRALVVATNTPVNDRVTMHTKQAPYRTYVIGARIAAGAVPKALYWDTLDPYHYVRLQDDLLIVGGEDHKTGQAQDGELRFQRLEEWARERFPIQQVEFRWSGQVIEPVDYMAFIGRNPGDHDNVFIATGDSGQGMTHGTIAGMLLTDLIVGRENRWAQLYNPSRKPAGTLGQFARENLNVAAQYKDFITPGEARVDVPIPPDSGVVVRRGMKKVAVYADPTGNLHECSAVCPHMKCIVQWNPVEKTWDCPCHGSRFDEYGHVLNGPANSDLEPLRVRSAEHAQV